MIDPSRYSIHLGKLLDGRLLVLITIDAFATEGARDAPGGHIKNTNDRSGSCDFRERRQGRRTRRQERAQQILGIRQYHGYKYNCTNINVG
ncbi:unnamed protein product, partial [Nesidiocoris tenuis]